MSGRRSPTVGESASSSGMARKREKQLMKGSYDGPDVGMYGRGASSSSESADQRRKRIGALRELNEEQINAYESAPMTTDKLRRCFAALDGRGTGSINVGDFCRGLQVFGDPFSIDEVEAFKALMDKSSIEESFKFDDFLSIRTEKLLQYEITEGELPVPRDQMVGHVAKAPVASDKTKTKDTHDVLKQLQDQGKSGEPSRHTLTKDQVAEFREAFHIFDVDGNGSVTTQELGDVMKQLGHHMSEAELQLMIDDVDHDHTGTMSFEEFLDLMAARLAEVDSQAELKDAFKTFDQDGDGYIEADELLRVMTSMGERMEIQEARDMLAEADVDGNGKIDYEEFVNIMLN